MHPRTWLMPLALIVAACASPAPSLSPSASPDPNLHIDGLATIARDDPRVWVDPVAGDAGHKKNYPSLETGKVVLLVDGPVSVDGVDYWQIYPSTNDYRSRLGWVAVSGGDGTSNLIPFTPECPAVDGITAEQIGAVDFFEQLACFGNRELTFAGTVTCNHGIGDGMLGGPMLNSTDWCFIEDGIALFGPYITSVRPADSSQPIFTGRFMISGHFDDPGAQSCIGITFGTSLNQSRTPGDPGAIQQCRGYFVVTAASGM